MPEKIDLRTYKNAVFVFYKEKRCCEDPTYEGEGISVRPRKGFGGTVEGEGDEMTGDGSEATQENASSADK